MPLQHEYVKLSEPRDAYGLCCSDPDTAVFFIHGFHGHSKKTWIDFQGLVDVFTQSYPWWSSSDLFFFAYDSVQQSMAVSTDQLREFVEHLFPNIIPRQGLNQARKYQKLVLVGHSEGAILIRRLVLNFFEEYNSLVSKLPFNSQGHSTLIGKVVQKPNPDDRFSFLEFVLRAELRLFAPAIMGAVQSGLLGAALSLPGIGAVVRSLITASPARNEMQPDTVIMQSICRNTEEFANRFPAASALRALVLWGAVDSVVQIGEYACDRSVGRLKNHNHTSICKPTMSYRYPLKFVRHESVDAAQEIPSAR